MTTPEKKSNFELPTPAPAGRCCETCACVAKIPNPQDVAHPEYYCRRNPPGYVDQRVRVENPDPKAAARGERYIEGVKRTILPGAQPVAPHSICFDGWRPEGTLPGDQWMDPARSLRKALSS